MKKFRSVLYISLLLLSLLLVSCGNSTKETETESSVPETAASETAAAETGEAVLEAFSETEPESGLPEPASPEAGTESGDDETPPAEGMVRSPLTNEWVTAEEAGKRPVAVMYPTDKKAQPQYGLDRVEIFYEIMEEGSMSRQMGLMTSWEDLSRIGNIRSTRDYFILESMQWDAILVHFGGPEIFVKDLLNREDMDNINGVGGEMGSDYGAFFRVPAGSKSEHTAYTSGACLEKAIEKAGFETTHRKDYWQEDRWIFASASHPVDLSSYSTCADAASVDMTGCYPITKSCFLYNAEDGLYYRSIYGSPQKDAVTGSQLAFRNILIESCTWGERGAGYLYFHVLDEGHTGYYITGGKMIRCTWGRTSDYEPVRFYDENGSEIILNTGKTMICIAREGDSFSADGKQFDL